MRSLEAWLRPSAECPLAREYPSVFAPSAKAVSFVLHDEAGLLAHAAVLETEAVTLAGPEILWMVGSVVVAPEARRKGLCRRLFRSLLEEHRRSRAAHLLLWSEKHEFYAKLGLEPVGTERILTLASEAGTPSRRTASRSAVPADLPGLASLHASKPSRIRRDEGLWEAFLRIPRCEILVRGPTGGPSAYAVLGKGLDFPDTIHEIGGPPRELAGLVLEILDRRRRPTDLLLPPGFGELERILAPRILEARTGILGLGLTKTAWPPDLYVEGLDSI